MFLQLVLINITVTLYIIILQSQDRLCKCYRLPKRAVEGVVTQAVPRPQSLHYVYTVNSRTNTPDACVSWWWLSEWCVYTLCACLYCTIWIQDFPESGFDHGVFELASTWVLPLTLRCSSVGWQDCCGPTSGHRCLPPHPHQKTPADDSIQI